MLLVAVCIPLVNLSVLKQAHSNTCSSGGWFIATQSVRLLVAVTEQPTDSLMLKAFEKMPSVVIYGGGVAGMRTLTPVLAHQNLELILSPDIGHKTAMALL